MNVTEIVVVLIGLVAGYWAVSKVFFNEKRGPATTSAPPPPPPPPPPPSAPLSTAPHWYDILGVPPTASEAEIRSAYQRLVSQYHPDKVDTLGPELKDLAIQKTQQITVAYREAMQVRGAST
jgi:DnaJ like chaperone protein